MTADDDEGEEEKNISKRSAARADGGDAKPNSFLLRPRASKTNYAQSGACVGVRIAEMKLGENNKGKT